MKTKLIMLFAMVLFAVTPVHSQGNPVDMTGNGDSVVNTGTKYLYSNLDGNVVAGSIVVKFTKTSGTARGTLTLQVSNDTTKSWHNVTNGVSHLNGSYTQIDTITNTTTQYKFFVIPADVAPGAKYIRVQIVGAGVSHYKVYGYIYRRKI